MKQTTQHNMAKITNLLIKDLDTVDEYRHKISTNSCGRCPLYKKHMQKDGLYPVVSRGNGRVMCIGTSPTHDEHSVGTPFQSKVASLLNRLFSYIGLEVDVDLYLTNIMLCRPSTEKDKLFPYRSEMYRGCLTHLAAQIHMVDPLIIVFFGKENYQIATGSDNKDFPGIAIPFKTKLFHKERWVMVMYNPAYVYRERVAGESKIKSHLHELYVWLKEHTDIYSDSRRKPYKLKEVGDKYKRKNYLVTKKDSLFRLSGSFETYRDKDPRKNKFLYLDTETNSLDIYEDSFKMVGASISIDLKSGFYLPCGHRNPPGSLIKHNPLIQLEPHWIIGFLKHLIYNLGLDPVFHNYYYDTRVLRKYGLELGDLMFKLDRSHHDSMHLAILENENVEKGLKARVLYHFGITAKKFGDVAEDNDKFDIVPLKEAMEYAGDDAVNTGLLFNHLGRIVTKKSRELTPITKEFKNGLLIDSVYQDELRFANVMSVATDIGMHVDKNKLEMLRKEVLLEELDILAKLKAICNRIEPSSPSQLDWLFSSVLKNELKEEFEDSFGWSMDGNHLSMLKNRIEESSKEGKDASKIASWTTERLNNYIDLLLRYRTIRKMRTSFLDSISELGKPFGKDRLVLHTLYGTNHAKGGRTTAEKPNLQQLPREALKSPKACSKCGNMGGMGEKWWVDVSETGRKFICSKCSAATSLPSIDIRSLMIPPEGSIFVVSDWSGMEMTTAGAVSADETLLKILEGKLKDPDNPAFDIHCVTAATVHGITPDKVTDKQRQDIKSTNFGAIYGITAPGLQIQLRNQGIYVALDYCEHLLKSFFKTYPGIENWMTLCRDQLTRHNYIVLPSGRIRHVSEYPDATEIRSATNAVIQGWCAQIMKKACIDISQEFYKDKDVNIVTVIHDEIVLACPMVMAVNGMQVMKKFMNVTVSNEATVHLTATPEIKHNLSKSSKSYSIEEWTKAF